MGGRKPPLAQLSPSLASCGDGVSYSTHQPRCIVLSPETAPSCISIDPEHASEHRRSPIAPCQLSIPRISDPTVIRSARHPGYASPKRGWETRLEKTQHVSRHILHWVYFLLSSSHFPFAFSRQLGGAAECRGPAPLRALVPVSTDPRFSYGGPGVCRSVFPV